MRLTATKDFLEALTEVDALISLAKTHEKNITTYQPLNKSNLVLLVVKFEVFIEDIVDEYVESTNAHALPSDKIPVRLKLTHFLEKVERAWPLKERQEDEIEAICKETGSFWNPHRDSQCPPLRIDTRFSFGKHGSNEIERLFKKIGQPDIFSHVSITTTRVDVSLEQDIEEKVDFKGTLDSLICLRNEIVHRDATPKITPDDLISHKAFLQQFSEKLDDYISQQIPTVHS